MGMLVGSECAATQVYIVNVSTQGCEAARDRHPFHIVSFFLS